MSLNVFIKSNKVKLLKLLVITSAIICNNINSTEYFEMKTINFKEIYDLSSDQLRSCENKLLRQFEAMQDLQYKNDKVRDLCNVFTSIRYNLSVRYVHQYSEEYWRENTYIPGSKLLEYKKLLEQCVSNNKSILSNEIINKMEEGTDINNTLISVDDLYYYIRNKVLLVGSNVIEQCKDNCQDEKVLETMKVLHELLVNMKRDIYSSNNILCKQINQDEIKWKLCLSDNENSEIIPYKKENNLDSCNYTINRFYKKYYHKLILPKVDKLHKNIIDTLRTMLSNINDNKTVVCDSNIGIMLDYDILRKYSNIHPDDYEKLTNIFKEGKEMPLREYLDNTINQLQQVKKFYDNQIKILYVEMKYTESMQKYYDDYMKDLEEKEKKGEITILRADNDYKDLPYEFNRYTENYIKIAKHLIKNLLRKKNNIKNETLEELCKDIEKSKEDIIKGKIIEE